MIIPEKQEIPKKNRAPVLVTLALCLFGYILLAFIEVKEADSAREYIREISQLNITRIAPKPEPELKEESEQPETEEIQEEPVEEAKPEPPKRINMSEVLPEGVKVDLSINRDSRQPGARQQTETTPSRSLRIEDSELEQMGGLKTLSDRGMRSSRADRRTLGNNSDASSSGITMEATSTLSGATGGMSGVEGGSRLGGPTGRGTDLTGVEVGMKNLEDFGEDYSEIDYNALVKWMEDNPVALPVPAERLMSDGQFNQNQLTSRVPFFIGERQFDLLLMVSEERFEVRIILVENDNATFLVDRGFRGESNRLRVGGVGYQDGEIAEIDSQMRDAGIDQTKEFYGIFLSWWESVKDEYEQ
ncbi:hypothetical protein [Rhodohalobacter sp. 8-1]|uniref:hypothetical protein n=1 Tax=Rhodohalobacter sp. 8-1 TaxID=3131972 RepID=UPI0030EE408F